MVLLSAAQVAKELGAGSEIEDAVDRYFFGRCAIPVRRSPTGNRLSNRYSRDIAAALELLTVWMASHPRREYIRLSRSPYNDGHWECLVEGEHGDWQCEGEGDTLPLAICRAALDIEAKEPVE